MLTSSRVLVQLSFSPSFLPSMKNISPTNSPPKTSVLFFGFESSAFHCFYCFSFPSSGPDFARPRLQLSLLPSDYLWYLQIFNHCCGRWVSAVFFASFSCFYFLDKYIFLFV